ncbi:MAG TPA: 2-C-methyl-D-erythritol 4-phosphate cytidylyltransferase [Thermaerobacter sp.]
MSGASLLPPEEVAAVIPAAGRSARMGGGVNKVFRNLGGQPVLARVVRALAAAGVVRFVIALRDGEQPLFERLVRPFLPPELAVELVVGGEERQDSVYAGLRHLAGGPATPRWVLVHDAARPLVSPELVDRVLAATRRFGAAVPGLPVSDTVKRIALPAAGAAAEERVETTLPREALRAVQTPQGFDFAVLWEAHQAARRRGERGFTDDAAVVERAGRPVVVVAGDPRNLKLTHPADFALARAWLGAGEEPASRAGGGPAEALPVRVGIGYDVHPVATGRKLVLAGVEVPAGFGLQGHSDADVVLHAVMDALLGAAGLPDIGHLFPPSDPRYAGADSRDLLRQVVAEVARAGWTPVQVDVTVVAERPRLAPFVPAMRERLAGELALDPARVGLKATTNEGLGFLGRGEGIAALAVALLAAGSPDAPA